MRSLVVAQDQKYEAHSVDRTPYSVVIYLAN